MVEQVVRTAWWSGVWTRNRFHHQPVKHHPPAGNQSPMTREWLGQHEMIYKVLFRTLLDGFFGPKKQTCQKQVCNPVRRQNNQKFNEIHQLKDILVFFGMEHPSKRIFFKTGPQGKSEVLLAPFLFKNSSLDRGVFEDSEAEDSGKFP